MTTTISYDRLTQLGVPAAFHAQLASRRAPRFHTLIHLTIVLASIAAAVAAIAVWSRYVDAAALNAAKAAHAILYDSDIGAESLGLLLTVLLGAGWLCGAITWRRGSQSARDGWASDLMHVPAKNKAIVNWLWRRMIRRYTRAAVGADDFLDRLGRGMVRDLRHAALAMLVLTAAIGSALPARVSYATNALIIDHPVLPFTGNVVRNMAQVTAIISGCPKLPKDGDTLVYQLRFADGAEANLGAWHPIKGSPFAGLEAIARGLPASAVRIRFSNPIGSNPLSPNCLRVFGHSEGANGIVRLLRLLAITDAEKEGLVGLL